MRRLFLGLSITMMLVVAGGISAQDLAPTTDFTPEGEGSWGDGGNWSNGTPDEAALARVRSGGTANVGAAATAGNLAVTDGSLAVGGATLTVGGRTIVSGKGHLTIGDGGKLDTGELALSASLSISGADGIAVGGAASLAGGTINLPAGTTCEAGFAPIPFMTAGSFASGQPHFPGSADCPAGLAYHVAYSGADPVQASVTVEPVITATVDRTTGVITKSGGPRDVKGYELTSGNGLLSADAWTSLGDQGVEGWAEASPNAERLTELNLTDSTTLEAGDTISMGPAWTGTTVSPREEDLGFTYLLADGREIVGNVEYTGPANDLVLAIDAEGNGTLQNTSASVGDFDVTGFSILSESGSLNVDGFTSLGEGWEIANPQGSALAQLNLEGSKVFSNGISASLGKILSDDGAEDLQLFFGVAGAERQQPGTVEYVSVVPPMTCADVRASRAIDGDLDGNNTVDFSDFLVLSTNFNTAQTMYEEGDIDCNGTVAFPDFLVLSTNFNKSAPAAGGAASVPEPTAGLLAFLGILGMLKFRKRGLQVAALMVVAGVVVTPNQSWAQEEFDTRFIRIHPNGPNSQINDTTEARGILDGTVLDVIKNEDIEGGVFTVDFAGGAGSFQNDQNPWGNGVGDETMDDFLQYFSGTVEIPEGDWTVGVGSDDGGFVNLVGVSLINTFNENGPTTAGDGEAIYNGTRGHSWTGGTFTVPAGGATVGIEGLSFERGGGDAFEIAVVDAIYDPDIDGDFNAFMASGFELDNGEFGDWTLVGPFDPGNKHDYNFDGTVDTADYQIMLDNWGNPYDFDDFVWFSNEFNAPAGAAAVPEPAGLSLLAVGLGLILSVRRRVRR